MIKAILLHTNTMETTKPMAIKKVTISLPEKLLERADKLSKEEYGTRSDLVREALRRLLDDRDLRRATVTAEEVRGIKKGLAEFARGDFVTLEDVRYELEDRPRAKRA